MNSKHSFLFLMISFLFFSCNEKPIFEASKSVGNFWHKDSIVSFDFEIHDTIQTYNVFLKIKANNDYPFSNLFLITSIKTPNEEVKKDTLEYIMTSVEGKILGNGYSKNKESKLWFKEKYHFSKIGVSEIGLNIERYK